MATLDILVKVTGNGDVEIKKITNAAKEAEGSTKNLKQSTEQLSNSFGMLKGAIAAVGIGALIKEGIQLADTYKMMNARLTLAVSSTNELAKAQTELYKMAQGSRSSLEATTALYTKLEMATDSMGKSQSQVLKVTEAVGKALKISGAGASESASAMMQLGQALASGVLRGDELNSIMENAPRLAKSIADGLGVTIGQLRAMGAEGQLTAEKVFTAIEKSGAKLDSEFKRIPPTVSDGMTQIQNALLKVVGEMDNATGASAGFSSTLTGLSSVLNTAADSLHRFNIEVVRLQDLRKINNFQDANTATEQIDKEIKALTTSNTLWDRTKRALESETNIRYKLNELYAAKAALSNRVVDMAVKENKIQDANNSSLKTNIALTKEQEAERKKRLADSKKEEDIQRGYLESYADLQAQEALDAYNIQLGYEESYRDIQAKNAIEQYEIEKGYLEAYAELEAKTAIEEFERKEKWWSDLFSNINKAMEAQFFDAMTGKFESFGSWLKDFWSSITASMAKGLSKSLADTILGTGSNGGGLQNVFKSFGGLSGILGGSASALSGATTDSAGFTTTAGGTVFDSAGQITLAGSDATEVLSSLSNAKSLYSLATDGITGMMYAPSAYMGQLAGTAYGAGFTGTGSFLGGVSNAFAGGNASGLSGAGFAGNVLGAGAMGAVGGYALGSLGDSLFGADTKAASYGAIGGGIGAAVGSIVPVVGTLIGGVIGSALGSVIGGMFGSTKFKGFKVGEDTSGDTSSISQWYQKKSWFSSSNKYKTLTTEQEKAINGVFETYDYLLGQLGSVNDIVVKAGRYSSSGLFAAIDKAFISAFVDNPYLTDTFYTAWTAYAKEIGKGVSETFATLISDYVGYTRDFKVWSLQSTGDSLEALRVQAEWAMNDFKAVEALTGTSGVTVSNYLDMYDKAIKESFTPETITAWQKLGDALMTATKANEDYTKSLSENAVYLPSDMMLSRTGASTTAIDIKQLVNKQADNNAQTSQMVAQLYEVVKVLKQQLTILQFGTDQGIPA